MSAIRPAAIASRSATGSRIFPSSETCPVRRAIVPSTQSVATTSPNSTSAGEGGVGIVTIRTTNTGMRAIRVDGDQVRDGEDRADDPVRSSPVPFIVGPAGFEPATF